jgi:chromosome partitioning protein
MTELKNYFGDKLFRTTVPRNIRLAEAPSHGKAALVYDPRSKGAESYIRLAKEIIEREQLSAVSPEVSAEPSHTGVTGEHGGDQEQGVEEIAAAPDMDKSA